MAYAKKFNEDESKWSLTALLHDFDYEIHPEVPDHPMKGEAILAERGIDPEIRRAILSHANYSGVSRDSLLEKTLESKSVRKKLKDKAFARSVNREDIVEGASGLCVALDEHIQFCIEAMQQRAADLGLTGTQTPASAAN